MVLPVLIHEAAQSWTLSRTLSRLETLHAGWLRAKGVYPGIWWGVQTACSISTQDLMEKTTCFCNEGTRAACWTALWHSEVFHKQTYLAGIVVGAKKFNFHLVNSKLLQWSKRDMGMSELSSRLMPVFLTLDSKKPHYLVSNEVWYYLPRPLWDRGWVVTCWRIASANPPYGLT